MINFNGDTRLIDVEPDLEYDVLDIYSRWKEWVMIKDNAKYLPAFTLIYDEFSNELYYILLNGWDINNKNIVGNFLKLSRET